MSYQNSPRVRRPLCMLLAVLMFFSISLPMTGCYGSFPATRIVHDFNGSVTDSGIIHTLILYLFLIIPVYSVTMLLDFFIFNLIEFWAGDEIAESAAVFDDGTKVTLAPVEGNPAAALLTVEKTDGTRQTATLHRIDGELISIKNSEGQIVGFLSREGKSHISLLDADKKELADRKFHPALGLSGDLVPAMH